MIKLEIPRVEKKVQLDQKKAKRCGNRMCSTTESVIIVPFSDFNCRPFFCPYTLYCFPIFICKCLNCFEPLFFFWLRLLPCCAPCTAWHSVCPACSRAGGSGRGRHRSQRGRQRGLGGKKQEEECI